MATFALKMAHREDIVLNTLQKKKKLKTREVAEILNVSECTVRRFFEELEKRGEAVRVYGGIKLAGSKQGEYHFENLQLRQSEQKQRIGDYASTLVKSGDILYLDSGTTIQQMALALARRFEKNDLEDVQIFTNSLQNLTILSEYCDINLIGGHFRGKRKDFCGYLTEMVLEAVSFGKCFLGADGVGINSGDGIMATDVFTAKINQIVSKRSEEMYLLLDSTKFVRRSLIRYAALEDAQMIITDNSLAEEMRNLLITHAKKVIFV